MSSGLDYELTNESGTLIFNWETVGAGNNLLMLTWPHHRLTMQNGNFPDKSALGYLTAKVSQAKHQLVLVLPY